MPANICAYLNEAHPPIFETWIFEILLEWVINLYILLHHQRWQLFSPKEERREQMHRAQHRTPYKHQQHKVSENKSKGISIVPECLKSFCVYFVSSSPH
jgi:uncharacterized protein YqhQ